MFIHFPDFFPCFYINMSASQTAPKKCEAGLYLKTRYRRTDQCTPCECKPGTASSQSALVGECKCEPCPAGKVGIGGKSQCTDCPAGGYTDEPGQSTYKPTTCSSGQGSVSGATSASGSCANCPPGWVSGGGSMPCTQCPSGRYSTAPGSSVCLEATCDPGYASAAGATSARGSCAKCPAGTFSPGSAAACTPCPMGMYSEEGAVACTPTACPSGQGPKSGATSATDCLACPAGQYSPGAAESCKPAGCTPGQASSLGATSLTGSCTPCPEGQTSAGGSSLCTPKESALSAGEIVGITFGVLAVVALMVGGGWYWKVYRPTPQQPGVPLLEPPAASASVAGV